LFTGVSYGGNSDDWVRGGQGDDVIYGDAGNDFMSGDKGDDTIYGGAGADRFNMVACCALDKVMDFKASEGDYVTIEGNPTAYRWFVGSDCYISASPQGSGSADVMILVGVSSDTFLGSHWYIAS
jgi:serralysin